MWKRKCFNCGESFTTSSISGRYCSNKCKQADYRMRKTAGETPAVTKANRRPVADRGDETQPASPTQPTA